MATLGRSVVINMADMFAGLSVAKVSAKSGFGFTELTKLLNLK